jgi:hypothetical protein
MKQLAIVAVLLMITFIGVFLYLRANVTPPDEKTLIANFNRHRAAFERLRGMVLDDEQLVRVATWGVETKKSFGARVPPDSDFPVERYREYLTLLKETGSSVAVRGGETHPVSVAISVWGAGWGGDTRHVQLCWIPEEPTPQVASLDAYYRTPKPRQPVFRKIEEHWYLWADW